MKFQPTPLPGVILIDLDCFPDPRGVFMETFHRDKYAESGVPEIFVQDNLSDSAKHTLRGLHAQLTHPQAKLIQPILGEIWDVAVDIRPGSATYKQWFGIRLNADKPQQLYVPIGFAHGFCVLSERALVSYKCTDIYDPSNAIHLIWNDVDLGIDWPVKAPLLSKKDSSGRSLRELEPELARVFEKPKSK